MTQITARGKPYDTKNWRWIRFKLFVLFLLNGVPPLKKLTFHIWRYLCNLQHNLRSRKIVKGPYGKFDIDKIYWIDPKRIKYSSLKEFDFCKYRGKKIGGDWDRLDKPFDLLYVYIAFKERFFERKNWKDTLFYRQVLDGIENGKFFWKCKNKSDLDARCKNLESLFQDIKNNGYKPQSQMLSEKNERDLRKIEDEITVNIGRNGDLLFNNGAHRLSIVKLLGIQKIPIKITVIHPESADILRKGEIPL